MDIRILDTPQQLAEQAAALTVASLQTVLAAEGRAVWVLAGGSTPAAAYNVLIRIYSGALDWSKITVLMGDERCVPLDHPDSNWGQVRETLDALGIPDENRLVPLTEQGLDAAAEAYDQALRDIPELHVVWLGVGEDGHTLSLFPGHDAPANRLVAAVRTSPKPPPQRITLTYEALKRSGHSLILAAGANKADSVRRAMSGDTALPVARAAAIIQQAGGTVTWLLDAQAAKRLS